MWSACGGTLRGFLCISQVTHYGALLPPTTSTTACMSPSTSIDLSGIPTCQALEQTVRTRVLKMQMVEAQHRPPPGAPQINISTHSLQRLHSRAHTHIAVVISTSGTGGARTSKTRQSLEKVHTLMFGVRGLAGKKAKSSLMIASGVDARYECRVLPGEMPCSARSRSRVR